MQVKLPLHRRLNLVKELQGLTIGRQSKSMARVVVVAKVHAVQTVTYYYNIHPRPPTYKAIVVINHRTVIMRALSVLNLYRSGRSIIE